MTKNDANFLNEKNVKITKRAHAFQGHVNTHNVKILSSFNSELQLKDTESAIKSKIIKLFSKLRDFRFVATLVLVFKIIESTDKTKYESFYSSSKAGITINESDIENVFKPIYTTMIANIQKSLGKVQAWLLIQSLSVLLVFQSMIP